jgi:hypothetical protein
MLQVVQARAANCSRCKSYSRYFSLREIHAGWQYQQDAPNPSGVWLWGDYKRRGRGLLSQNISIPVSLSVLSRILLLQHKLTSKEKTPAPESPGEEGVSPLMCPLLSINDVAMLQQASHV